ncbi:MAG: hypothetical protein QXR42_09330 [Candidatus Bathyarchaeia archaeon]
MNHEDFMDFLNGLEACIVKLQKQIEKLMCSEAELHGVGIPIILNGRKVKEQRVNLRKARIIATQSLKLY